MSGANDTLQTLKAVTVQLEERERELQETRAQRDEYWDVMRLLPVGLWRTDLAGQVTYWNESMEEIAGLDRDSAKGTGWLDAVHPEDRAYLSVAWSNFLAAGEGYNERFRFLHPDGTVVWAHVTGARNGVGYCGAVMEEGRKNSGTEQRQR